MSDESRGHICKSFVLVWHVHGGQKGYYFGGQKEASEVGDLGFASARPTHPFILEAVR